MDWRGDLLNKAETYCQRTGIARSGLGKLVMNDAKFFDEIEFDERSCTIDTLQRVLGWFKKNMPKKPNGKNGGSHA